MADAPPIPCSTACRLLFHSQHKFLLPIFPLILVIYGYVYVNDYTYLNYMRYPLYGYTISGCLGCIIYYLFLAPPAPRPTFGHQKPRTTRPNPNPGFVDRRIRPLAAHRHLLSLWAGSAFMLAIAFFFEKEMCDRLAEITWRDVNRVQNSVIVMYLGIPPAALLGLLIGWRPDPVEEAPQEEQRVYYPRKAKNNNQKQGKRR